MKGHVQLTDRDNYRLEWSTADGVKRTLYYEQWADAVADFLMVKPTDPTLSTDPTLYMLQWNMVDTGRL
jgi:hypothetical protein